MNPEQDPFLHLDQMQTSGMHLHGSLVGDSVHFVGVSAGATANIVVAVAMLPVHLVRRLRGNRGQ